jgi:hypothetical protein
MSFKKWFTAIKRYFTEPRGFTGIEPKITRYDDQVVEEGVVKPLRQANLRRNKGRPFRRSKPDYRRTRKKQSVKNARRKAQARRSSR